MTTRDEKVINLVRDLQFLVKLYGAKEVQFTLDFLTNYPDNSTTVRDIYNNRYDITKDDYNKVLVHIRANEKIQAIKVFREITSCGLKEAKDVIEFVENWRTSV